MADMNELPQVMQQHVFGSMTDLLRSDEWVHCTELLGCLRKPFLRRKHHPERTITQTWPLFRGKLFDKELTPLYPVNQLRCTHRVPRTPLAIVGTCDYIEWEDFIIGKGKKKKTIQVPRLWDLKTTNNLRFIRRDGHKERHERQIMFYAYCNAISRGGLVYLSLGDCKKFELEWTDEELENNLEYMAERAKVLHRAIAEDKPPEMEDQYRGGDFWECKRKWCECVDLCWKGKGRKRVRGVPAEEDKEEDYNDGD